MSIAIMSQLFKAHLGSTGRKMLAVRLADFADDDGKGIWPTVGRLAQETELSERTVQRILAEFVEEGILVLRKKGGSKPGEATRYDFDMAALNRLTAAKTAVDGCQGVTHDTVSPVTPATATGDTDDSDGCHGVTQTIREPLREPLSERDARATLKQEKAKARQEIEAAFWRTVKDWPGHDGMPKDGWKAEWFKLTPEERATAESRRAAWLALLKANHKTHTPSPLTYFRQKLFEDVPAMQEAAKPQFAMAAPYGKLWSATRLSHLLAGATGAISALTTSERAMIAAGQLTLDAVVANKRRNMGWPTVNAMQEQARSAQGFLCPLALDAAAAGFRQVDRDSDLFQAWKSEHARRGWPFFDDRRLPKWIWFPAVPGEGVASAAVMAALEGFHRESLGHGSDADAA